MNIRIAEKRDLEAVIRLYKDIIEDLDRRTNYPEWHWGSHPDLPMLEAAIDNHELWLYEDEQQLYGAAIVNSALADGSQIDWSGDDFCAIHLFGIHPERKRKGMADDFLTQLINAQSASSIRLNFIAGNFPAENLYARHGFVHRGAATLDEGDGLLLDFVYMEKQL